MAILPISTRLILDLGGTRRVDLGQAFGKLDRIFQTRTFQEEDRLKEADQAAGAREDTPGRIPTALLAGVYGRPIAMLSST
jgi:hypothetical protein